MKTCECGHRMNTAYIYRKDVKGRWQSIGHYCVHCGAFAHTRKLKLVQSIKAREGIRKDERKRVC